VSPEARIVALLGQIQGIAGQVAAVQIELQELRDALRHDSDDSSREEIEYTISQLCTKLGVSRQTLWSWWNTGNGPPKRHYGRRVKVAHSDFVAWQRSRTKTA